MAYLRQRPDVDGKRFALWGESFAPTNGPDTNFKVPREADTWPRQSEPLGGLLGLLGALFEDDVRAVHISGGLASYHSVLSYHAVLIPHDASVPGALTAGDLSDLAGGVSPHAAFRRHGRSPEPADTRQGNSKGFRRRVPGLCVRAPRKFGHRGRGDVGWDLAIESAKVRILSTHEQVWTGLTPHPALACAECSEGISWLDQPDPQCP